MEKGGKSFEKSFPLPSLALPVLSTSFPFKGFCNLSHRFRISRFPAQIALEEYNEAPSHAS